VSESPIEQLLGAIENRDVEAAMALMAPDCELLAVDGRRAEGAEEVRQLFADLLATLRSTTYRVTAQWHQDDVWIAEVEGTYELQDRLKLGPLPRAFVLRDGSEGFVEFHAYGARERPLTDYATAEKEMRLGGHWIPPL
jgi:SnoaL-like protein